MSSNNSLDLCSFVLLLSFRYVLLPISEVSKLFIPQLTETSKVMASCAASRCQNTNSLFAWPSSPSLQRKWTEFVRMKLPNFQPAHNTKLCFRHFKDTEFSNWNMCTLIEMPKYVCYIDQWYCFSVTLMYYNC